MTAHSRAISLAVDIKALETENARLAAEVEELEIQCAELLGEFPENARIDQLTAALAFYADPQSYVARNPDGSYIWVDAGKRARRVLGLKEGRS